MGRRRLRSVLTISGIVIGILALTTMGAIAEHFNSLLGGGIEYYTGQVPVNDTSSSITSSGGFIPLSKVGEVEKVQGVSAAFPNIQILASPGGITAVNFGPPDYVAAYDPRSEQYANFKLHVAKGTDLPANSSGQVVVGSTFARDFKLKVGDTVDLPKRPKDAPSDFVNHPFTVVGIYQQTLTIPDNGAFVSLGDAQMLLKGSLPAAIRGSVDTSQLAQSVTAYALPGTDTDKLADRINAQVPGVKATHPSELVAALNSGGQIFTAITTAAALIALVVGGLSVVNTMIMAVTERIREIGLRKAVGAKTGRVMREYLLEATMIGLLGGLVGLALGWSVTALLNLAGASSGLDLFLVTPRLAVIALVFATGLGALAGIIPALRAARMDPVTALRAQ